MTQSSIAILLQHYKDLRANGYWFAAKRFGWGWMPITWQGWLATLIYVFLIAGDVVGGIAYDKISHSGSDTLLYVAPTFLLYSTLFILLCYAKGEKPRWNWSIKPDQADMKIK